MKNNKIIINLIIILIGFTNACSEEVEFKAKNIEIKENGNKVFAYNSETIISKEKIRIISNKVRYNKVDDILVFTNQVQFDDKKNDVVIQGKEIRYEKKKNLIYSRGTTEFDVYGIYKIVSKNVYFDREKKIIYGSEDTNIIDEKNNIFNLKNKFKFDIKNEILKSKKSDIIDNKGNRYKFQDLVVNLKINEIVGKEIKVEFNKTYFGNENNDPILKGRSSYSSDDELKVYKAVFSTCNVKNKTCRGWELNADEFKHDKREKIFEYKNSWLKIFDYKLLFVPYFNHPDPSVKRKSGFLTPTYNSSDSLGTSINFPYFKVIDIDKDITFSPRYYADKSFLLQNEYRQALQGSNILSDFSFLIGDAGTKGHLFYKQSGKINNNSDFELNIQNVKGDNYLKTHKLIETSSLISNDSLLLSNLDLNWDLESTNLNTSFKIYEDLSRNYHDRYQYIFPDFDFYKKIVIPDSYKGQFEFNSYGYNKLYDTNVSESVLTNDFIFSSNNFINDNGISTNYDILIKNSNNYSNNSLNYNDNLNYDLFGIFKVDASYPLLRRSENSINYLTPILSFRYSPNGNSDLSNKDVLLNYNNVFNLNRIGSTSQVEGGESLSLGLEFKKNSIIRSESVSLNIANIFKFDENNSMPSKSKLDKKRSDVVGNLSYNFNENLNFEYIFSYDKDLKYSNLDQLGIDLSVNNFLTNISYHSEHNDLLDVESVINKNKYSFDDENKLSFELSKDLDNNFTQYYKLIYSHETDCISVNLNYNKSFYRDGSLEPSKSLSFLIKIIPFTELGVPNIGSLVGN